MNISLEEQSLRSRLQLQSHVRDRGHTGTKQQFVSTIPKTLEQLGILTQLRNATYATADDASTSTLRAPDPTTTDFDRSINPISTRSGRFCPPNYYSPPPTPDF